jgi:hypothetical protein
LLDQNNITEFSNLHNQLVSVKPQLDYQNSLIENIKTNIRKLENSLLKENQEILNSGVILEIIGSTDHDGSKARGSETGEKYIVFGDFKQPSYGIGSSSREERLYFKDDEYDQKFYKENNQDESWFMVEITFDENNNPVVNDDVEETYIKFVKSRAKKNNQ